MTHNDSEPICQRDDDAWGAMCECPRCKLASKSDSNPADEKEPAAVEQDPAAFVNLVMGDEEPLTADQQAYIDATQLAYEQLVTETYERVKAELEANPDDS